MSSLRNIFSRRNNLYFNKYSTCHFVTCKRKHLISDRHGDGGNGNEKGGHVVEGKRGDSRDGDAHEREAASFGGKTSGGNGNGGGGVGIGGGGGIGPVKTSGRRLAWFG